MKPYIFLLLILTLCCDTTVAGSLGQGLSLGYGQGEANSDIDIYRVSLKKDFSSKWFETDIGFLSGYFELSYNRWENGSEATNGVSISPVFAYFFGDESDFFRPYIEGGIGIAYIDDYRIGRRNLSTHFQFEDRIGIGTRLGRFDINFRYMHYSNGSIKSPNDGMDIWIFSAAFAF